KRNRDAHKITGIHTIICMNEVIAFHRDIWRREDDKVISMGNIIVIISKNLKSRLMPIREIAHYRYLKGIPKIDSCTGCQCAKITTALNHLNIIRHTDDAESAAFQLICRADIGKR